MTILVNIVVGKEPGLMSSSAKSAATSVLNGRSDAKRDAIVRGAKAVFLKHGFEGTSMDVVALRAGVSKMTVYRHFGARRRCSPGSSQIYASGSWTAIFDRLSSSRPAKRLRPSPVK